MLGILGADDRCPIARSLDVLGEKWTLLIVRNAFAGATRFSQFQSSLGIPRDVLTARLASLVESGVLQRRRYKPDGGRARDEYVLTGAGRELSLVLLALGGWADRHRPAGGPASLRFVEEGTGRPLSVAAVIVNRDSAPTVDRVVPTERVTPELTGP